MQTSPATTRCTPRVVCSTRPQADRERANATPEHFVDQELDRGAFREHELEGAPPDVRVRNAGRIANSFDAARSSTPAIPVVLYSHSSWYYHLGQVTDLEVPRGRPQPSRR